MKFPFNQIPKNKQAHMTLSETWIQVSFKWIFFLQRLIAFKHFKNTRAKFNERRQKSRSRRVFFGNTENIHNFVLGVHFLVILPKVTYPVLRVRTSNCRLLHILHPRFSLTNPVARLSHPPLSSYLVPFFNFSTIHEPHIPFDVAFNRSKCGGNIL